MIETDICIIGAGPVGLFTVFEAGLLKLRCHLVDYLPQPGGQLSEIYPKKPIYDIPGFPTVDAQELVDNLLEQGKPFNPTFTLGERIETINKLEDGSFELFTHLDTKIHAKVICIAGGLGVFEPRKPAIENLTAYEKNGVEYMVLDPEKFRNKKIVIAGGGDSALDWTLFLADVAAELTMVHRGETFRGAPDSVDKVKQLAAEGKINLALSSNITHLHGDGKLEKVTITHNDTSTKEVEADNYLALFGLSPKLGPIANWGLNIEKNAINVDTRDYSTNIKGIYAIGDINNYEGKLKLILCGFHEAAIMCHSAAELISGKKPTLKYTTVNGVNSF
ncbi:MAG TPA: NAD(P)/FAD-dependent oxidoreductase [Chitinophagales bacterium]|nr:NAD(P)/FAD-dependent oxidoreductase [Chitinophagales bacterium]HMW11673.1 NAD(P)/FAD-dependent oxidoreductase [Chitinophagales bacterium]HMX59183.1 NAD(P)/FAD-dependent oxidoreductase [Chitinophagales bacterium]HMY23429.1 NAD(P)/FAD-dependent oxidoreductase [Chitinophagales bacterium]HMZ33890.1 NAD(P)/FAD-dependent oxidoreductase [Chitinophagales bacterium]